MANAELLAHLEAGARDLRDSLDGITDEAAGKSLGTGRWSVLECVEHVAMGEEVMLARLTAAVPAPALRNEGRERIILARGADRTRRAESPEPARPAGRFATVSAAMNRFLELRSETERFVRECPRDLHEVAATHPLVGPVNGYELVLIMAVHPARHAGQIREIRGL